MKDFYEITPTNMLTARGYSMTPQQQQQFQSNIGPISPQMAWQYPPTIKTEERNNDSGITSCSDFNSSPSGSETMDNFSPKNEENFPKINYHTTPIYKKQQEQQPTPKIKEEIMDTSDDDRDTTLKKLEMSLEKNLSSSPGLSETSNENYKEEDDYNTPRLNSHGKVKTHKCKHCPFVAITRADFWAHQREHINPDKLLKCQQCPFVSEYKHHLEYHMRNHDGSKPFKCKSCDYTCVNKSMLNSHLKSHSNVYQYRCNTCNYSSKYCHSLKLHLRKHKHEPAMVLNPDGTPNPLPIIDVYGTRRGPKIKHRNNASSPTISTTTTTPPIIPPPTTTTLVQNEIRPEFNKNLLDQYLLLQQRMTEINQHQYQQQLQQLQQYQQQQQNDEENVVPLDLRCKTDDEEDDDDTITTVFPNVEVVDDSSSTTTTITTQETKKSTKTCQFCDITFGGSDDDVVLHSLHMNQHGFVNPFTCNMCGEKCEDKIKFQLHIVRSAHIL